MPVKFTDNAVKVSGVSAQITGAAGSMVRAGAGGAETDGVTVKDSWAVF